MSLPSSYCTTSWKRLTRAKSQTLDPWTSVALKLEFRPFQQMRLHVPRPPFEARFSSLLVSSRLVSLSFCPLEPLEHLPPSQVVFARSPTDWTRSISSNDCQISGHGLHELARTGARTEIDQGRRQAVEDGKVCHHPFTAAKVQTEYVRRDVTCAGPGEDAD